MAAVATTAVAAAAPVTVGTVGAAPGRAASAGLPAAPPAAGATVPAPDPRFLRLDRTPPAGAPHRLRVRTDLELRVRLEPPGGSPAEEIVLEGGRRLDAELTVLPAPSPTPAPTPAAADAGELRLRLRIIDGEHRPPGGGVRRLPVGRTLLVGAAPGAPADAARIEADDDAGPIEAGTREAVRAMLAGAGLVGPGAGGPGGSGGARGEAAALGLDQPRAIGGRWRPDGPAVARLADVTIDGGPPPASAVTAVAERGRPIARGGRVLDVVEVELEVGATADLATGLLRELGGRGPVGDGAATLRTTLLLPRAAGAAVAEDRTRLSLTARSAGLDDVPPARLLMTAATRVRLEPVESRTIDAAIARARARTAADPELTARVEAGAAARGLSIAGWRGDPAWTLRDPDDPTAVLEAVREDGVVARVLRPDVVGRHGFSVDGLDRATAAVVAARPGHRLGEPFELAVAPRPLRARFGRRPGGEQWTVAGFVAARPVALVIDVPEGGPLLDRTELRALHARVTALGEGARAEARDGAAAGPRPRGRPALAEAARASGAAGRAVPGVLRLGGPGGHVLPPAWLGLPGADLTAAGEGWRLAAWTVPHALPPETLLLMLDAAAGETGFERRPDASGLVVEPVRRLGRTGRAAVTPTARLEVLAGEDDLVVLMAAADGLADVPALRGALDRLVLTGPITTPPRDRPAGPAAGARSLAAAAADDARLRRAAELVNAYATRLMRIDEPAAAAEAFAAAARLDPRAPLIRLNRALALAEAERLMAAAAVIDGDPALGALPAARRLRARISLDAGDAAGAVRRYEALLADVPDPQAAANLVFAVREVDGPAAALARGRAWMDAHGEHPMVLLSSSIVAADAGDPAAALAMVDRAIELAPGDASLRPFRDRYRSLVAAGGGTPPGSPPASAGSPEPPGG